MLCAEVLAVEVGHFVSGDTFDVGHNLRTAFEIVALCFRGELVEHRRCGLPIFDDGFKVGCRRLGDVELSVCGGLEVCGENAADAVFSDCVFSAQTACFDVGQNGIVVELVRSRFVELIVAVCVFILATGIFGIFEQKFVHAAVVEHKHLPCISEIVVFLVGFDVNAVPVRRELFLESFGNVLEIFFELSLLFVRPTIGGAFVLFRAGVFEGYVFDKLVDTHVCVRNELLFECRGIACYELLLTIVFKSDDIR